jgi:DNA-binding HxlR family transcriptional regulator
MTDPVKPVFPNQYKENFNLEHFQEVLKLIPAIKEKALEAIRIETTEIDHTNQRRLTEREFFNNLAKIIQGKWLIDVIYLIINLGKPHFNDLLNNLPGISSRTLTDRLRILEDRGIISRHVIDSRPIRVFYTMTKLGEGLLSLFMVVYLYALYHEEIDQETIIE